MKFIELFSGEFFPFFSVLSLETTKSLNGWVAHFSTRVRKVKQYAYSHVTKRTMDTFLPLSRSNVRSTDIDFYSFSSPLFSSFQCSKPRVHQFHPSYLTYTYNEIWWSHLIIIDWTNISSQFPYFWLNIHECVCARERYKQAHKQTNGLISSTNRMNFFSYVWHFYDFVSIQFNSQLQLWIFKPIHHSSRKTSNTKKVKVFACVTLKT